MGTGYVRQQDSPNKADYSLARPNGLTQVTGLCAVEHLHVMKMQGNTPRLRTSDYYYLQLSKQ